MTDWLKLQSIIDILSHSIAKRKLVSTIVDDRDNVQKLIENNNS